MAYVLHYAPDNASQPVMAALEMLGLAYERRLVDRRVRAQKNPVYLRLNPNGLIPVLETPDGPIFETAACLLWLADRHGALAPAPGEAGRGTLLKWLFFASNTLHTDLLMAFYADRYAPQGALEEAYAMTTARLAGHWNRIEAAMGEHPALAAPSVLTLYLASLARWSALFPIDRNRDWFDIDQLPQLKSVFAVLERTPALAAVITAEGLNTTPFTSPEQATPPEGSAL